VPYLILELGSHFPAKKLIEFNSWRERERERERNGLNLIYATVDQTTHAYNFL
jgi:hypothetical protein